jgi:hypothetical protein
MSMKDETIHTLASSNTLLLGAAFTLRDELDTAVAMRDEYRQQAEALRCERDNALARAREAERVLHDAQQDAARDRARLEAAKARVLKLLTTLERNVASHAAANNAVQAAIKEVRSW